MFRSFSRQPQQQQQQPPPPQQQKSKIPEEQEEEDDEENKDEEYQATKKVADLSRGHILYTKEEIQEAAQSIDLRDDLNYLYSLDILDFDQHFALQRDRENSIYKLDNNRTNKKIQYSKKDNLLMSTSENQEQQQQGEEGIFTSTPSEKSFAEIEEEELEKYVPHQSEIDYSEILSQYRRIIGYPGKWENRRSRFNSMMLSAGDMNEGISFAIQRPLGYSFVVMHNILLCPKPPQGLPPGSAPESDYSFGVSFEKYGFSMFGRTHYSGQSIASIHKALSSKISTDLSLVTHRAYGFKEYNWNMDYRIAQNSTLGVRLKKGNIVGLSFMQGISNSLDAGTEFSYDFQERKSVFGIGFRFNKKFNPLANQPIPPKAPNNHYIDLAEREKREYFAKHLLRSYLTNLAFADPYDKYKLGSYGLSKGAVDSLYYGYYQPFTLGKKALFNNEEFTRPYKAKQGETPEEYLLVRSADAIMKSFVKNLRGMTDFQLENEYTFDFFLRDNNDKNITESEAKFTAVKEIGDRKHALSEFAYNFSTRQARARFGLQILFSKGKFRFTVDPNLHLMMAYDTQLHRAISATFTLNAHPEKGDYKFGVSLTLQ